MRGPRRSHRLFVREFRTHMLSRALHRRLGLLKFALASLLTDAQTHHQQSGL